MRSVCSGLARPRQLLPAPEIGVVGWANYPGSIDDLFGLVSPRSIGRGQLEVIKARSTLLHFASVR
jgi:hypothetical protein